MKSLCFPEPQGTGLAGRAVTDGHHQVGRIFSQGIPPLARQSLSKIPRLFKVFKSEGMNLTFRLTTGTAGPQNTLTSLAHYGFAENAPASVMGADKRNVEHMNSRPKKAA